MDIVKLLLYVLTPIVVLGLLVGWLTGRHQVKKMTSQATPLLTARQRLIYGGSILVGTVCILVAVFYNPAPRIDENPDYIPGMTEDGLLIEGGEFFEGGEISGEAGFDTPAAVSPARPATRSFSYSTNGGEVVIVN